MMTSSPFKGLFFILGQRNFFIIYSRLYVISDSPEKSLEFCEISHERGPRSPAGTPKDRTTPTPGTAPAGRRGARRHSTPAARGAATRGRRLPGHSLRGAATRRRAAYIGGAGVYRRAATSGALRGARGAAATGAAYTRRRGYRAKQGGCSPNVGGYRARGYPGGAGGLPIPGRRTGRGYTGGGLPGGRRQAGAAAQLPPAGRLPRRRTRRQHGDLRGGL